MSVRDNTPDEDIRKLPQTVTMVLWEYYGNLVKSAFLVGFPIGIVVTVIGFVTPWYIMLLQYMGAQALQFWYLILAGVFLMGVVVHIFRDKSAKPKKVQPTRDSVKSQQSASS